MSLKKKEDYDEVEEPKFRSAFTGQQRRLNALRRSASDEPFLYGVDTEWTQLIKAYRKAMSPRNNDEDTTSRGNNNLVLIRGPSGVGKSSLAQKLKRETKTDGGWFVAGEFDMLQQETPYSAFIQAFSEFARLLTSMNNEKDNLVCLRQAVRETVHNPEILTTLIPDLSLLGLIDARPESERNPVERKTDGRAMKTRFLTTFRDLLRAIGSLGFPLVVLLDDVHFSGDGSLELLGLLLDDKEIRHVLFVCTAVREIPYFARRGPRATRELLMTGLTPMDMRRALTTYAGVGEEVDTVIDTMSGCLYRITSGNCAFLCHLLLLREESTQSSLEGDFIRDPFKSLREFCSEEELSMEHVVKKRIALLPKDVRNVLGYAAFVGYDIDKVLLCKILQVETIEPYLKEAELYGLIRYVPERNCFKFSHDSVREALLSAVPHEARPKRHLAIGRQLWKSTLKTHVNSAELIFVVLDQIRRGEELIVDQQEKVSISTLCMVASERAVSACSFRTAAVYLEFGIRLSSLLWEEHRDLNFRLRNACCEAHFVLGDFDRVRELITEIEDHSTSVSDELRARTMRVYIMGAGRENALALDVGLDTLRRIGCRVPIRPTVFHVLRLQWKVQQLLRGKSDECLMRLPLMLDKQKLASMKVLNVVFVSGYQATEKYMLPTLILQMVCRTLEHGLSTIAPVAFAAYGALLITCKRFAEGQRFGKLALALLERQDAAEFLPRVYALVYFFILPWHVDLFHVIAPLKRACLVGLETGDVEYATASAVMHSFVHFVSGTSLIRMRHVLATMLNLLESRAQVLALYTMKSLYQMVIKLMDPSDEQSLLRGDEIDGEAAVQELEQGSQRKWHLWTRYLMCVLAYLFGDFARAASFGRESMVLLMRVAQVDSAMIPLVYGLASLAVYKQLDKSAFRSRRKHLSEARRSLRYLRFFSIHSPQNALGLHRLLEAEYFATTGKDRKASESFFVACGLFAEKSFPLGRALGHELWGRYLMTAKEEKRVEWEEHIRKAHMFYKEWGAFVKVEYLVAEFPLLREKEPTSDGASFYLPSGSGH